MAITRPFSPEQFTPTRFNSAEDKAKFANDLARFVERGMPRSAFTKALYTRLSNCFGHIAEYDRDGFYTKWFADSADRAEWFTQVLRGGGHGSPEHTYCDVELAFRAWLADSGHLVA